MERFIRKKYQEKSLAEGRPEPPRRNERSEASPPVPPKSPDSSPPPPLPSKKGRFFGFGLRASSSAYPLSKHDKKKLPPEPRVESAWTIDTDRVGRGSRMDDARAPMTDAELQMKLHQLRDMGFSDTERNTNMLRKLNGNVERTVEALVQLGPSVGQRASSAKGTRQPTESSRTNTTTAAISESTQPNMRSSTTSSNPFDMPSSGQGFGISMAPPQQPQATGASYGSNNPFDQPPRSQTNTGLNQAFGGMQISQPPPQPLFPHSTGGYPMQQPQMPNPRLQTMTPPVPSFSHQQYGYTASPPALAGNTNPFFQTMQQPQTQSQPQLQTQPTGSNPFFSQMQQPQQQSMHQASANPFMNSAPSQQTQATSGANPFGIPPSGQSPPHTSQGSSNMEPIQSGYQASLQQFQASPTNPFQQQTQQQQSQTSSQFPNFAYGQPQQQYQPQQQQMPQQMQQQAFSQYQTLSNPYSSHQQVPSQYQQPQSAPLMPQQTGRYDKQSILALYNYPQLAPAKAQGLSSIPEPGSDNGQTQDTSQPRRSATMPISMGSMHSAGGAGMAVGNKNPFMQNNMAGAPQQQPAQQPGIMRHASQESVNINNLESGRHSPDAFANLSARSLR